MTSCKERFLEELADKNADLADIFQEAFERYDSGKEKYGTFNPITDQRDFRREIRQELIDAINYLAMFILKIDKIGVK